MILVPYLALLYIVLLAINGTVYQSFYNTLTDEVEKSQLSMTSNTQKFWDGQMEALTRIALSIGSNDKFAPYKLNEGGYDSYLAEQELVKIKSGNDTLTDIIYYPLHKNDFDYVYSTETTCDFSLYFDSLFHIQNMSTDSMRTLMKQINTPTILPMQKVSNGLSNDKFMLYLYPLKSGDSTSAVILFVIRDSTLKAQLGNLLSGNNGYVYILNSSGKMITDEVNGSGSVSSSDMLRSIHGKVKTCKITISGCNYILTCLKSPNNGWYYYVVTDSRQFMSRVYSSRAFFNTALLLLAIIGSAIAFMIALRNYLPLRELAESINTHQGKMPLEENSDEIKCISQYISKLSQQNQNYELRTIIRNFIFGRSVDKTNQNIVIILDESGLQSDSFHYRVLFFFCDSLESCSQTDMDYHELLEMLAAQSGIEKSFCFEYSDNRSFPILLCYSGEENSPCVNEFIDSVSKMFGSQTTFTVGIGSVYQNIFDVNRSMQEASAAIYYRVIRGKNSIIDYSEIQTTRRHYVYPFACEQKLTSAVKQAKNDEIEPVIQEVINYIESNTSNPDDARGICMGLAYAIVHTLEELRIDINTFDSDENYLYPKPYEPVEQFASRVCNLCERVCNYLNQHKESKNEELAIKAGQYIRNNFSDYALSLNAVADYCNVSVSYLSRFFKEQYGESVVQYIDRLRMEHAKKLLSESNLSLKEITSESGYGSETNFIRKFKKKEGITPMQYREVTKKVSVSNVCPDSN